MAFFFIKNVLFFLVPTFYLHVLLLKLSLVQTHVKIFLFNNNDIWFLHEKKMSIKEPASCLQFFFNINIFYMVAISRHVPYSSKMGQLSLKITEVETCAIWSHDVIKEVFSENKGIYHVILKTWRLPICIAILLITSNVKLCLIQNEFELWCIHTRKSYLILIYGEG